MIPFGCSRMMRGLVAALARRGLRAEIPTMEIPLNFKN
jgi:hypothetical protein